MITYIKRKDLDVVKYDDCISLSLQSRIYAFSWYLDIVADHWDVLVLNDYEAVMPIPVKQKLGIKYIAQPLFCQQLGVFSKFKISEDIFNNFLRKLGKGNIRVLYQFNSSNSKFSTKKFEFQRINYVLKLDKPYTELRKKYRKDRKSRLNQVRKKDFFISKCNSEDIVDLAKTYYPQIELKELEYNTLSELISFCLETEKGFTVGVYENKILLGASFFLKDDYRLTYLFSASSPEGKKYNVNSLILDEVIQRYSNSNLTLDFEGSMNSGIASFFRSFGAEKENYIFLKKRLMKLFSLI